MSESKTVHGVTEQIFECVKTTSNEQHGTVYDPATGNSGTATTSTSTYTVKLNFTFDPGTGDLTYTIVHKTWIVPTSAIWTGIGDTINGCRKS